MERNQHEFDAEFSEIVIGLGMFDLEWPDKESAEYLDDEKGPVPYNWAENASYYGNVEDEETSKLFGIVDRIKRIDSQT